MMLRKILGPEGEEVKGVWTKLNCMITFMVYTSLVSESIFFFGYVSG